MRQGKPQTNLTEIKEFLFGILSQILKFMFIKTVLTSVAFLYNNYSDGNNCCCRCSVK